MKKKQNFPLLIVTLFSAFLISCGGEMEQKKITYKSLNDIPDSAWEELSHKKIFFGHQSVGNNIIAGFQDLIKENPKIKLNIIDYNEIESSKNGFFAHNSNLGKNDFPETKIEEFDNFLSNGMGNKLDLAFMKFCFADFKKGADINSVFSEYENTIQSIRKKYPNLGVVHFTVPLLRENQNKGFKAWLKNLIGKGDSYFSNEHNVVRNIYSDRVRERYREKEPIFDIAKIESTYPDGTRCTFKSDAKTYYSLVSEYTDDGGHLNEVGRKKLAEQLLLLLANL